jgi:hypothetical protein
VRRIILHSLCLTLVAAQPLLAGTFDRTSIAPELGLDALTRGAARQHLGRDLFARPYATVTLGSVDVYAVFPYVESRTFQVVSDPRWNRLIYGESGRSVAAYDGKGKPFGPLADPRGMAVDEANRVYVADAGNDRILVLQASTEFGAMELVPLFEVRGLARPQDVAYSDGGTPFVPGDDRLYVADTGKNRVVAFALAAGGARQVGTLGELGSGRGRFAGPMAIAVGRSGAGHTPDVYVADAHTRRIVHLRHEGSAWSWVSDVHHEADLVTSLDTDQWGNLYAAAPHQGVVRKLGSDLAPVAELVSGVTRPRAFHVPFVNVRDHRNGSVERVGKPNGLTVDEWSETSGLSLWTLGLEVSRLAVAYDGAPAARFTLTDRAEVFLEIADASTGQAIARRSAGRLEAGSHTVALGEEDLAAAAGATSPMLRLAAVSSYPQGPTAHAQTALRTGGNGFVPGRAFLLPNAPNPLFTSTRIVFVLPAQSADARLEVMDASGRTVRRFTQRFAPGPNQVIWDGTGERGVSLPAGVYFYRLASLGQRFTRKMILVR